MVITATSTVQTVRERFPQAIVETVEFRGEQTLVLKPEQLLAVCGYLQKNLQYTFLSSITAVDWPERIPRFDVIYPGGEPLVRIDPGPLGARLEGASRPGHFAGMLTVVHKLLQLTAPHVAFFGEKDFQQLVLIRRMVRDLDLPVQIVGVLRS